MYEMLYYGGFSFAILMFGASVLLFIRFRIPGAVGNLTGHAARKSVKKGRKNKTSDLTQMRMTAPLKKAKTLRKTAGTVKLEEAIPAEAEMQPVFRLLAEITFVHSDELIS